MKFHKILYLRSEGKPRDDVSTDEITPVAIMSHYDEKLGQFAYTGFKGDTAIARCEVIAGGFDVTVAGKRYGKGSSREHSPAAEKIAGIRLVIAESFERIYRQNADNIGLFTSTDLSLVGRIERGEEIGVEELLKGRDEQAAAILRAGGLLKFGASGRHPGLDPGSMPRLDGSRVEPGMTALRTASMTASMTAAAPMTARTLFEKIVDRRREGAFVRPHWRFIHEYYTGMAAHMLKSAFPGGYAVQDPDTVVVFEDHSSYVDESPAHIRMGLIPNMRAMQQAQRDFIAQHRLRSHRTLTDDEARADDGSNVAGISHAMMAEHYALPGQVVVGTDSHTPHSGSLGCVAFGVGTTDMANAFVNGSVRLGHPEQLRIELHGPAAPGIAAKDIVLHLLALPYIKSGGGVGKVFEFTGSAVTAMSIDERATLTNMTAELGGFTGIVAPDEETVRFLKERRGIDFTIEPWMRSDEGAAYAQTITVDCSQLSPMVAAPGDPGNGIPLDALEREVKVDIAYGGSCTAGKREDFDRYHEVLAWGLSHGMKVPSNVQLYLQYGTTAVRDYCIERGYDRTFAAAGARILQPSCGACANCGPGSSTDASQVTVSAINRNFPGRSGPGQVWLASPATVMASALAGKIVSFASLRESAGAARP